MVRENAVYGPSAGACGLADAKTWCPWCRRLFAAALERCPRCPPLADPPRGGRCPRCRSDLAVAVVGDAFAADCAPCGGRWFDRGEVERAFDFTIPPRSTAGSPHGAAPSPSRPVRYKPCVRCGSRMARRALAPKSGVVVDVCREHGLWLDAGAFDRFAAFVASGGLVAARDLEDSPPRHPADAPSSSAPLGVLGLPVGRWSPFLWSIARFFGRRG